MVIAPKTSPLIPSLLFHSYLQRHQSAKPSPQYGSRQMAICREEYNSHWSLTALQRALTAEWDIWKVGNMEQDGTGIPQAEKISNESFEKFQFPPNSSKWRIFFIVSKSLSMSSIFVFISQYWVLWNRNLRLHTGFKCDSYDPLASRPGLEHFITQIPWDNLFRKSQCFYLNIAGTFDPPPTGLWYNQLASTSEVSGAVVIFIFCSPGILPASREWVSIFGVLYLHSCKHAGCGDTKIKICQHLRSGWFIQLR